MEKIFRLYNRLQSSFFDLIEGNLEPQQTKGLGLLLSESDLALNLFFELLSEKANICVDLKKINQIFVNCELISSGESKFRADIILRLYADNKPYKAFLIEAKSVNKNTSATNAYKQIENYQDKNAFIELKDFADNDVCLITLTKIPSYNSDRQSVSITWSDIIEKFHRHRKEDKLLNSYYNFLTNIKNAMKFFEKEIYSIPAGNTYELIKKSLIYECPADYKSFQKPLFFAPRKGLGGEMDSLYTIEELIILNFQKDYDVFLQDSHYSETTRNKVKRYVDLIGWNTDNFPTDDKMVFVLSDKIIKLPIPYPRPEKNNSFRAYYDLADFFDEEKRCKL